MSFRDLKNIGESYRTGRNNISKDFYIPVLKESKIYKRAVGYFSSNALVEISRGIYGLLKNGGKIHLIANPHLSEKDIEAIEKGYADKDKIVSERLASDLLDFENPIYKDRLTLMATLVRDGILDIKIAELRSKASRGIYHEKIGLMYDNDNNIIAFTGSTNETFFAMHESFESFDVYCSWQEGYSKRIIEKEHDFQELFEDKNSILSVKDFPDFPKSKLIEYAKRRTTYNFEEEGNDVNCDATICKTGPSIPDNVTLEKYQEKAIENWFDNKCCGIFNMATGTGKTYTALAAAAKLFRTNKDKLGIIIVCPYMHLVEQWKIECQKFSIDSLLAYSESPQKSWKMDIKEDFLMFDRNLINYFCIITTNSTFSSEYFQNQIKGISKDILLIIDEAHYFGATNLRNTLPDNIPYRIALSATINRHRDFLGTNSLFQYFKNECINFGIQEAIMQNKLTPYYYFPIITNLTEYELEQYEILSKKISKCFIVDKFGNKVLNALGQRLSIKRARIIAGAANKLSALKKAMFEYKDKYYTLVYCGATTIIDPDFNENKITNEESRQIKDVTNILGIDLKMFVGNFTSRESMEERKNLLENFEKAETIQALIAIRCLDEGINIPKIQRAFILASSTNPKEYIQRRGRVLRKCEGKSSAEIFDFITLPRPINETSNLGIDQKKYDLGLVKRELVRLEDFYKISNNIEVGLSVYNQIVNAYKLDRLNEEEIYD